MYYSKDSISDYNYYKSKEYYHSFYNQSYYNICHYHLYANQYCKFNNFQYYHYIFYNCYLGTTHNYHQSSFRNYQDKFHKSFYLENTLNNSFSCSIGLPYLKINPIHNFGMNLLIHRIGCNYLQCITRKFFHQST